MNNRNKKPNGAPAALLLKKTGTSTSVKKDESFIKKNSKSIFQGLVAVVVVLFAIATFSSSSGSIKNLINADDEKMKDALLGDIPYLFYCHRGRQDETVPTMFSDLSKIKSSATMGFALVNCSQVMPSGKTLWDRFKLKKDWQPTMFETAPWTKPKQVPPLSLKDVGTLKKFVDGTMGAKGYDVVSDKELVKFCGFGKKANQTENNNKESGRPDTCFILMKGTRYTKAHADLEERIVRKYPKVKIATINASKKRLSMEDTHAVSADMFALKIHALRNATHSLSMVNPVTWDYVTTFMSQAISSPSYGFEGEADVPIRLIKAGVSPFKSRGAEGSGSGSSGSGSSSGPSSGPATARKGKKPSDGGSSKGKTDTTASAPTPSAEETKEERQIREKRRRDEMERQAQEQLFEVGDHASDEGEEEEDEDDSVIEL